MHFTGFEQLVVNLKRQLCADGGS